jgi:putative addiction module CopG family antidote
MTVTLTPEMEALVNEQLATGQYATREEVVRAALLLVHQRYGELKAAIAEGMEDIKQGRVTPFDPMATLARVKAARAKRLDEADSAIPPVVEAKRD